VKLLQNIYILVEVQSFSIWQTCVHYLLPVCVEIQRKKNIDLVFLYCLGGKKSVSGRGDIYSCPKSEFIK